MRTLLQLTKRFHGWIAPNVFDHAHYPGGGSSGRSRTDTHLSSSQ
jgi:hypothetical protein